jgi:hypothetical protein
MVRHKMDFETTIEQKEWNATYYEYIICKSYHNSSRSMVTVVIKLPCPKGSVPDRSAHTHWHVGEASTLFLW